MAEEKIFQRPETVALWVEVTDWAGVYVNPSNGGTITITDPDGIVVVTNAAMTPQSTGNYIYYHNTTTNDKTGWYKAVATFQDGTGDGAKKSVVVGGFQLQ